jgi:site-specific recombinase XerD
VQELVRTLASREAQQARADAALARRSDQRETLQRLAEELDSLTPHTFRHSLARRLIQANMALPEVQAVLGHSSLRIIGMYLTPHEQSLDETLERGGGLT